MSLPNTLPRPRWEDVRGRLDLVDVATKLLGPPQGRRGERSDRRAWWSCPVHADGNPSFLVGQGDTYARCFGCGWRGDAVDLVRVLHPDLSFPEIVSFLAGDNPGVSLPPRPTPARSSKAKPRSSPSDTMLGEAEAVALVERAEGALWSDAGAGALEYLRGRGLDDETIKSARLGWTPRLPLPGGPSGVVVPWIADGQVELVKLRQPEGVQPKYREVYRRSPTIYPDPDTLEPGRPVVIVEGEFDALLVGQEVGHLASVATIGSASVRPSQNVLVRLLTCSPWVVATDNDPAGEKRAGEWAFLGKRFRRVRPPDKDWTDTHAGGFNRLRYILGRELGPHPDWSVLEAERWSGAQDDVPV